MNRASVGADLHRLRLITWTQSRAAITTKPFCWISVSELYPDRYISLDAGDNPYRYRLATLVTDFSVITVEP